MLSASCWLLPWAARGSLLERVHLPRAGMKADQAEPCLGPATFFKPLAAAGGRNLPATNPIAGLPKVFSHNDWSAASKPFAEALEELSASLENSTVGLAFFDPRLRCQALNRSFAAMWESTPEKFLGQTLQQAIGAEAKKLRSSFERALASGAIIPNAPLFMESSRVRRAAGFYPFVDDQGRVRAIAVTLCDASTLEFHLANLVSKLQMSLPAAMCLLGASFPEVLARSLQSSTRSIRTLRNSLSPRSLLSPTQLEIGMMPLALFLSLTGSRSPVPPAPMPMPAADRVAPAEPASDDSATLPSPFDEPSPRELQVLRLLAAGRSNKEIGIALNISTRTVETYRARIIRKLGLHSTAELVRYAIRNRIVEA